MSLCLAAGGLAKTLAIAAFTLVWTHSIEKTGWEEDWRVTAHGLQLVSARIKGFGAGMEPPPEARLQDGWFRWDVDRPPQPELLLGHSGAAGEWRLCAEGSCRTLSEIFGRETGEQVTVLRACDHP